MQFIAYGSNLYGLKLRTYRRKLSNAGGRMSSAIRSRCTLSAENCCLEDNNKVEESTADKDIVAPRSGIVRHVHGDTEASAVPTGKSVSSIPSSKRLPQRPSHPPPPPPCPSGDNVEEEAPVGEGQLMSISAAQMTELNLQLQQLLQPRCKNRPGQRSPRRHLSASQQSLHPNHEDEKDKDEKDAAAEKTAVSGIEIPIDSVLLEADYGLDRADDVVLQKLREKEDAAETECDVAAAAADISSTHADIYAHGSNFQRNALSPTADDEANLWSSKDQWMKRPCGVIVEEASLDELLEKTEKLEQELRKQLDIKRQKTQENARHEERIRVLEQMNAELRMKLTVTESELAKKDIRMAVIEENNGNLAKRLKSTQDVLTKLENDYERVVEEKLEFKSLYIDCRFKSSEAIGDLREEINRQIEAKRSFIRLAKQNIEDRSDPGLKKALATTSDYLRLKCERNQLLDKVQYLKTKVEAQDLYIEDLTSAVKELSRIIQHYKVSLPSTEEQDEQQEQYEQHQEEAEQDEEEAEQLEDKENHSSTVQCAAMTEESPGNWSPTSEWTTETSPEEDIGEGTANQEEELEDICDETSGSECLRKNSERGTILEFRTPMSSPSLSIKSRTPRPTADDDDYEDEEKQEQ